MADEYVIANVNSFADEGVGRYLAAAPNNGSLNLNEGTNLCIVADGAIVQVYEIEPTDISPETYVLDDISFCQQ
jgi:hypothetical protein